LFVEKEKLTPVSVAPVLDFSPPEKIAPSPAMPTLAPSPRGIAPAKPSLGLSALERSGEEQLLLRALLDTDEQLSLERVIEMSSQLPGIAACALVRGDDVIAGDSTKGTDAKAFRAQAAEVAKSLRTLAPLIGISDAETFTLNTDSRLITLCFPGEVTLAILHDREPTLGLRDKLTLIARQLDSMVRKG
jgi:predicted regulator of Ras-like GTPase activity (Roadblock/LC7/MglB family)